VATITTKEIHRILLEWKPINERMIQARYDSSFAKLTTIICYAPTEEADDEDKDAFYETPKEQLKAGYKAADKQVKRRARADKKATEEAETAASKQDMRTLYRLTKTLAGKSRPSAAPIKEQQGDFISKEGDFLKCWKEHFERVLNRDDP